MGKTLNYDIKRKPNAVRGDFPEWKNVRFLSKLPTSRIVYQIYGDEHITEKSALISRKTKDIVFEYCTFIRCTFKNVEFQAGFHKCVFIECVFENFCVGDPCNGDIEFVHYAGFFNCEFTECKFSDAWKCEFFSITNCYFKECNYDEVTHLLFRSNAKIRCTNKKNREHISKFLKSGMYVPTKSILPQNEIIGFKYALASLKGHRSPKSFGNLVLVKLLIPTDSIRFCPDLRLSESRIDFWNNPYHKCRCEKAKVIEITGLAGFTSKEILENLDKYDIQSPLVTGPGCITYEVGKEIKPDWFNMNPLTECTGGIHFFLSVDDTVRFAKSMC